MACGTGVAKNSSGFNQSSVMQMAILSHASQSLQAQESMAVSAQFRPDGTGPSDEPEEYWDLQALGTIGHWVIEKSSLLPDQWTEWAQWAGKSMNRAFPSAAHSMQALPGMVDMESYGIKN